MRIQFSELLDSLDHLHKRSSYIVRLEFHSGYPLHLYYQEENRFFAVYPNNDENTLRIYRLHFNDKEELEHFRNFFFKEDEQFLTEQMRKQFEALTKSKMVKLGRYP